MRNPICCSDGPNRDEIALIGGEPDEFIADDFTTFVEMPAEDTVDLVQVAVDLRAELRGTCRTSRTRQV